ncbi:MAG: amylo-alpha-1,6-glucosidase [Acidiferrobacter sp.]
MNAPTRIEDRFGVTTETWVVGGERVLKDNDTFVIMDARGDIAADRAQGLFHQGTRFLSVWRLLVDEMRPLLLSSTVKKDNSLLLADLTNHAQPRQGRDQGTVHIFRTRFLWQGTSYERLRITNYGCAPATITIDLEFAADFKDLFELRGMARTACGTHVEPLIAGDTIVLGYQGRDQKSRRTRIAFSPRPEVDDHHARWRLSLAAQEGCVLLATTDLLIAEDPGTRLDYEAAFAERTVATLAAQERTRIFSSNPQFNSWIDRSAADLLTMTSDTVHGRYPYAGIPWYSTVFGRDGLITAIEMLWIDPTIACGVLGLLAAYQADGVNPAQAAEPGKIVHEIRAGEMAALNEVPFRLYYGSADATPLFVLLAALYFERTADVAFMRMLWPHIERALTWIDEYGDGDGDGFVEYATDSPIGLRNQGWKDSPDAVFGADGVTAEGPIALCEVQAYVYAAKSRIADVAAALGHTARADSLRRQAHALQVAFNHHFWLADRHFYALALDGGKRPLAVRASNAGHVLFAGLATPVAAAQVAAALFEDDFFSGWGIRTVAAGEPRYNPLSYHNGSVWPHDNALAAAGLARYGYKGAVVRLTESLFEASQYMDLHRLPELFCGLRRHHDEAPTLYPVACSPQASAAAAVFLLIQSCLGLTIRNGHRPVIHFEHPVLPQFLTELRLEGLRAGTARVDLVIRRYREDVDVHVLFRHGDVDILVAR